MSKRLLMLFFLSLLWTSARVITIATWNTQHLGWGQTGLEYNCSSGCVLRFRCSPGGDK
jgi:hypothetical protein